MPDLKTLQQRLDVTFADETLLQQALVHPSYLNENPDFDLPSNERLEFFGDSVLGLVVAEQLYIEFPELDEGKLTKMRAALVQKESLAEAAAGLDLGSYLYLGQGEEASGGRKKPTNLACALEAVIGAIFLDQGLVGARETVLQVLESKWLAVSQGEVPDYKSQLQELIQAKYQVTPVYRLVETSGPNHAKVFVAEVLMGETLLGRGRGRSKRAAEKEAARVALKNVPVGAEKPA